MSVLAQLFSQLARQIPRRGRPGPTIQGIDPSPAPTDLDDLPAQHAHEVDIVGLEVSQNHGMHADGRQPHDQVADRRRFAQPGKPHEKTPTDWRSNARA